MQVLHKYVNVGRKPKTFFMIKILFLFLIASLIISCKKNSCTGNCGEIQISGQVIDTSTNKGLANVPIQVYWQKSGFCISCNKINVTNSKTSNEGNFNFSATVDKDRFKNYFLFVEAAIPNGYIHSYSKTERVEYDYLSEYDPQVSNLRFVMYPKANLSIKVVKNQNDNFNFFDVKYTYSPTSIGIFNPPGTFSDTTFSVETSANIFTKIEWRKGYGFGQTKNFADSIKCSPVSNNSFTINY